MDKENIFIRIEDRRELTKLMAQKIGENLHEQFNQFKRVRERCEEEDGSVVKQRCCHCGQTLPSIYTQEWLATQVGISKATIVHYFQGNRIPPLPVMLLISKVICCSLDVLLHDIDPNILPVRDIRG